jgi:hypothetical protein
LIGAVPRQQCSADEVRNPSAKPGEGGCWKEQDSNPRFPV